MSQKKNDKEIAYAAAVEGVNSATSNVGIVGRYLWNLQMKALRRIGLMPIFKSNWWLFLILGFVLLAFLFPFGVLFVLSAWCAGQMDPKSENDFIVELRHDANREF